MSINDREIITIKSNIMLQNMLKLEGVNKLKKNDQKRIFGGLSLAGADQTYNCTCKNQNVDWTQQAGSASEAAESISSKCDDGQGACW